MGVTLTSKNASFAKNYVSFVPPVSRLLQGFFLMQDGILGKNLSGGADATVVGSPTLDTAYSAALTGTAYLDTAIAETADMTFIAVARVGTNASQRQGLVSNFLNNAYVNVSGTTVTAHGTGIVVEASGAVGMVGATYDNTADTASAPNEALNTVPAGSPPPVGVAGSFKFLVGTVDSIAKVTRIRNLTDGKDNSIAASASQVRDLRNGRKIRIGAVNPAGATSAPSWIMGAAIHSGVLTEAEVQAYYTYFKAYALRRSVII